MNKEELKRRSEKMTKEARIAVAQRGIMQFRANPKDIEALYSLAMRRNQRVSTMIREWVLDRLQKERGNIPLELNVALGKEKVGSIVLTSSVFNVLEKNRKTVSTKKSSSK